MTEDAKDISLIASEDKLRRFEVWGGDRLLQLRPGMDECEGATDILLALFD